MEKSYGKVNGSIDRVVVTCFEINFLIESVCRTDVYFQYIQTLLKSSVAWKNPQMTPYCFHRRQL